MLHLSIIIMLSINLMISSVYCMMILLFFIIILLQLGLGLKWGLAFYLFSSSFLYIFWLWAMNVLLSDIDLSISLYCINNYYIVIGINKELLIFYYMCNIKFHRKYKYYLVDLIIYNIVFNSICEKSSILLFELIFLG